jgi:hypothetical protein
MDFTTEGRVYTPSNMQKKLKIKTKDGHIIYGTLDLPSKKKDKLIIFVHGVLNS